jgi:hypothetical protein
MDSEIVDRIAKGFARSGSRRGVVQALAAGAGIALVTRASAVAETRPLD